MKIVILGCGRIGSRLAMQFVAEKHLVSVIDFNKKAFARLPADFSGMTILGTGIDEDVLRSAGLEGADVFLAVTNGDNTNLMATQIAKHHFKVPRTFARVYDPIREEIFRKLGLETIPATTIIAARIHDRILSDPPPQTAPPVSGKR